MKFNLAIKKKVAFILLILPFSILLLGIVGAIPYNYTSGEGIPISRIIEETSPTADINYSLVNVNNSQYFQGFVPSDFLLSNSITLGGLFYHSNFTSAFNNNISEHNSSWTSTYNSSYAGILSSWNGNFSNFIRNNTNGGYNISINSNMNITTTGTITGGSGVLGDATGKWTIGSVDYGGGFYYATLSPDSGANGLYGIIKGGLYVIPNTGEEGAIGIYDSDFATGVTLAWSGINGYLDQNLVLQSGYKLGIGVLKTDVLGNDIELGGAAAKSIKMMRHTSAISAGLDLTITAGSPKAGLTNKNSGDLVLKSGTSTGTGSGNIEFYTATAGTTGTSDRAPTIKWTMNGAGSILSGTDGTSAYDIKTAGDFYSLSDSKGLVLGAGSDANIYFDGSDLIINSLNVTANDEVHFTNWTAIDTGNANLLMGTGYITTSADTRINGNALQYDSGGGWVDKIVWDLSYATGTMVLDSFAGTSTDAVMGTQTYPWGSIWLGDYLYMPSGSVISDGSSTSIDPYNKKLMVNGFTMLDWSGASYLTLMDGSGDVYFKAKATPYSDNTYDLGGSSNYWKDFYIKGTTYMPSGSVISDGTYTSIDPYNRILYASDGSTTSLDWSSGLSTEGSSGVDNTYDDGTDTQITFTNGLATAISTAYDESLMHNINYLGDNPEEKLTYAEFEWNEQGLNQFGKGADKTGTQRGYVAQDVQMFYPDCVVQKTLKQMETTTTTRVITITNETTKKLQNITTSYNITKQIDTGIPVITYNKGCLTNLQLKEKDSKIKVLEDKINKLCGISGGVC